MGYIGQNPFGVPVGGTGVTSVTANNVLLGNGTSAITSAAAGTTGQLLIGTTSAAPSFSSTSAGSFSFSTATVGGVVGVTCNNSDNTSATSNARFSVNVGGASAGDPVHQFIVNGVTTWTQGIDNSDSDMFKISASAALGTTDVMTLTTGGILTYPLQSCFLAYLDTTVTNATGAGGTYTLGSGTALTKIFDSHTDLNTNGTYTAPATAKIDLRGCIYVSNCTIATTFAFTLTTSNRNYTSTFSRAALAADQTSMLNAITDMDLADTAICSVIVSGEAGNTNSITGGSQIVSYFCGAITS